MGGTYGLVEGLAVCETNGLNLRLSCFKYFYREFTDEKGSVSCLSECTLLELQETGHDLLWVSFKEFLDQKGSVSCLSEYTLLELQETGYDLLWVSVRKTTNAPWLLPFGKLLKL